ncbi:MAG TPA: MBL fold metallo-hydrolase [Rhizomicrobium sp.]|jgi:metallo-beta-lactamase class B|nr:MBL fold metallo-hydrolase [Rhizomicrobium sp.]
MRKLLSALLLTATSLAAGAQPAVEAHLAAAKKAEGTDFPGTIARLCIVPDAPVGAGAGGGGGPRPIPDRASWYAEPARMFDNLYWVGTKIHSAWALQTSGGIILIDTLYNYAVEPEIVQGLIKLGLNPANIKYVIITHAHGDHDEGARLLQDRFGAHVVMGAADWDLIEKSVNMPGGVPKRDIVGEDGQKITLGDSSVTIVTTPGHTLGTLSLIFTVKDRGRPITVAYSGGTAFNFQKDVARYDTYIASQKKMAEAAKAAGATIVMSNHSEFDDAWERGRLVRLHRSGEPHPYELGNDAVQRYFTMTGECAMAMREKLTQH